MLFYDLPDGVLAFTASKGDKGTEFGVDARVTGIHSSSFHLSPSQIMIPRQTHSVNVAWVDKPGEVPNTDAVITDVPGLCVAVKTADCIPILLYDEAHHLVAAIHAGWRGTVGCIVERTIIEMASRGEDIHAIIGPGISLSAFEVGDEVYDQFLEAGFPMDRIAKRYPPQMASPASQENINPQYSAQHLPTSDTSPLISRIIPNSSKWHIDLWEANRWLLERCGVNRIHVAGLCTYTHLSQFYSARQESINTGRNINGIQLCLPKSPKT